MKRKDIQDPYAYSSWTRNVMRKRRGKNFNKRLKIVVKNRDSTERRVRALEVRFLRNLRNKTLLCKYTRGEPIVEQQCCTQAWKRRQKQSGVCLLRESYWRKRQELFNVYLNNSSTATKGCLRQGKLFNVYIPCLLYTSRCV